MRLSHDSSHISAVDPVCADRSADRAGEAGRCAPGTSAAGKDARADKTEFEGKEARA